MKNENGIEKSAILKGQTLVNLHKLENYSKFGVLLDEGWKQHFGNNDSYATWRMFDISMLKPNTDYGVFCWVSENTLSETYWECHVVHSSDTVFNAISGLRFNAGETGMRFGKLTTISDFAGKTCGLRHLMDINTPSTEYVKFRCVLMEYQEGMENWDIPYFTGMKSVQMPSLMTTGKNLFDASKWINGRPAPYSGSSINQIEKTQNSATPIIECKPNTTYTISRILPDNSTTNWYSLYGYNKDGLKVQGIVDTKSVGKWTFTTNNDVYYLRGKSDNPYEIGKNELWQIEEGSTTTSYEPYKPNILTVNEDVTLRGIGNVQDELDLVTGEKVERIGEVVLDGSEKWSKMGESQNNPNLIIYYSTNALPNSIFNTNNILCDKFKTSKTMAWHSSEEDIFVSISTYGLRICLDSGKLESTTVDGLKKWLTENKPIIQYPLTTPTIKTVDLSITDQDNQPQERMKLFPNGYINTSSSTFPPILELKGITHNNKLNMTTTNGTNNTQLTTLDNLALDGIICYDGIVVRDSYDVESGLYTKRVFRFTIDEEFIERYRGKFSRATNNNILIEMNIDIVTNCGYPSTTTRGISNNIEYSHSGNKTRISLTSSGLWFTLVKEELTSYDVDGLLDWIRRNGTIEVAYQMATPQIIHMQPNMQPYVSTRPYQGFIESQGNILESSFLDYTSEQSIISPKPLGDGDVLKWEQGSQCYVYENDKEYIPLTDYNQPMGTVLDLDEEDGEQFVENLDGGDIIVDVPFKEKAVYERHLVSHEDNVIYPTQDKLDPTGKIEVDYICGETWQNPNDLADIRHVGTLREDGQYDVTIRRSGDDEIRLMDGITNLSLDGDGLNPSEFELTFFNSGGVEVGKYGDTSHTLEDCVLDSKLETGTVYGDTLINLVDTSKIVHQTTERVSRDSDGWIIMTGLSGSWTYAYIKKMQNLKPDTLYTIIIDIAENTLPYDMEFIQNNDNKYVFSRFTQTYYIPAKKTGRIIITRTTKNQDVFDNYVENFDFRIQLNTYNVGKIKFRFIVLEGDYTSYPMDILYFEGVGSTIVNGFTTVGKNLFGFNDRYEVKNSYTKHEILDMNSIIVSPDTTSLNWINAGFYNYYLPHKTTDYFIISRKEEVINGNPFDSLNLYDADDDGQMIRIEVWEHNGYKYDLVQFKKDGERANIRFYCGSNEKMGTIKYSDIQITKYSQRPSRINEEFEPYQSVQYTLPTPITLNKLGDVIDTYDVVSGVETRKLLNLVFDGSNDESWVITFYDYGTAQNRIYGISIPNMIKAYENNYTGLFITNYKHIESLSDSFFGTEEGQWGIYFVADPQIRLVTPTGTTREQLKEYLQANPLKVVIKAETPQTIQHTLIPSTVETMQEPTFILPQPLRSVPNGICDRLYWDENKGHYCIEKRVERFVIDGSYSNISHGGYSNNNYIEIYMNGIIKSVVDNQGYCEDPNYTINPFYGNGYRNDTNYKAFAIGVNKASLIVPKAEIEQVIGATYNRDYKQLRQYLTLKPVTILYPLATSQIIDLPHLNKKLALPTQPDTLPIGYKIEYTKANPQLGLTIPYKQLNYPSRPQNIDFKMDIADYVLTWDDVKEARQYNVILNDRVIATVKEPQWNSGEEMYGYIMVEAQNELAENLSEELYIKTVPNAPAQLTVAHNPMTNYYDFEISFIKTSAIAEYYTVQYRIDGGEWVYKTIQSDEIDTNSKVLWRFSIYEINEQIEVWATATNEIGTNDILPVATYYMSPTPQWTYRVNSKELFVRWMDDSPYDTQYKLRYQYKSDGIYRYAYFEGDKQEIGKLYEALIPLADDEEVAIALCIISEKENLYTKPIKASKELDPNIKPPKNFNYHWLARGLIEFYWEDNYDVDVEYEAIVEHRLTSGNNEWITDTRIFSATDTEGTGTVYRLSYQLEDLEEIRVKVRMKWAMNDTEWTESLTTVFIPVEGNPPQWIRRTQTQEGLLVEWEAQEYVDSYHVYVMSDGEELQHLETMDNFIYVDLDYSNPIDIEIYEATRFSGGIQSDPTDKMCFRPTMDKHQLIHDVVTPDTLTYEIEVDTVQKGIKERQVIHDINTTPKVTSKQPMDVAISSPFTLSFHPLQLDVHQAGAKYYGDTELHIKTLDVKSRDSIEVLTFERITDQYGVDFTVYTPSASKYPITLEVNRVRIVCFGDSLTSGHPGFWAETGTGDPQHCYEYWLDRRLKGQYEIINKGYGYFM